MLQAELPDLVKGGNEALLCPRSITIHQVREMRLRMGIRPMHLTQPTALVELFLAFIATTLRSIGHNQPHFAHATGHGAIT